jgi:hypothetical protein
LLLIDATQQNAQGDSSPAARKARENASELLGKPHDKTHKLSPRDEALLPRLAAAPAMVPDDLRAVQVLVDWAPQETNYDDSEAVVHEVLWV